MAPRPALECERELAALDVQLEELEARAQLAEESHDAEDAEGQDQEDDSQRVHGSELR